MLAKPGVRLSVSTYGLARTSTTKKISMNVPCSFTDHSSTIPYRDALDLRRVNSPVRALKLISVNSVARIISRTVEHASLDR